MLVISFFMIVVFFNWLFLLPGVVTDIFLSNNDFDKVNLFDRILFDIVSFSENLILTFFAS